MSRFLTPYKHIDIIVPMIMKLISPYVQHPVTHTEKLHIWSKVIAVEQNRCAFKSLLLTKLSIICANKLSRRLKDNNIYSFFDA